MEIKTPEYASFKRIPKNYECKLIDTNNLIIEILWWVEHASKEFSYSDHSNKLDIEWSKALTLRYKREKDWKSYPVCALSFEKVNDTIKLKQLQWSKNRQVAFRVFSSFDVLNFYLKLLEDSFLSKWIDVEIETNPSWVDFDTKAFNSYTLLEKWLNALRVKYIIKDDELEKSWTF